MRARFDQQLEELNREMIRMGTLCETSIRRASEALIDHDLKKAETVSELLTEINEKNREIENICLRLLLQQQPVAKDLRTISSALRMVSDMYRIGVQSSDIAEIIGMDHIHSVPENLPMRDMAESVIQMVSNSIDAFVLKNLETAQYVEEYDDVIDRCFDEMKLALIEELKKPDIDGEEALDLLMIAKYFERIGDHAVNIAGWVIFSITGVHEGTEAK